jgi:hypothetical protein
MDELNNTRPARRTRRDARAGDGYVRFFLGT